MAQEKTLCTMAKASSPLILMILMAEAVASEVAAATMVSGTLT